MGSDSIIGAAPTVPQPGPTFTVTDTGDGDVCTMSDCTLRGAIDAANAFDGAATIAFAISGVGVQTISTGSPLPAVTNTVTIDATTQPGWFPGLPAVTLSGNGNSGNGLTLTGAGDVVQGLRINAFVAGDGILIDSSGDSVFDCQIGVDASGGTAAPNHLGVEVVFDHALIGNTDHPNVIAGNLVLDVWVHTPAAQHVVVNGNLIGLDSTGTHLIAAATTQEGVQVSDGATSATVSQNVVASSIVGVHVDGASAANVVNNKIGTNAAGSAALSPTAAATAGVYIDNSTKDVVRGNVISGNSTGVLLQSHSIATLVFLNDIGTDAGGNVAEGLGNRSDGIRVAAGGTATIGAGGFGNRIAGNAGSGVDVAGGPVRISQNSIDANGLLGIALEPEANGAAHVPAVQSATAAGGTLTAMLSLAARPSTVYTIELFDSATCDPSGYGEGAVYLGTATATTDATGHASLTASVPAGNAENGDAITATATDSAGETSSFSACRTLLGGAAATSASISVSSSSGSTEIGAAVVPQSNVPSSALRPLAGTAGGSGTASSPLTSVPLTSVPLTSVPLTSVDLSSSPLTSVPLTSVGFTPDGLRNSALGGVPLSQLPLNPPLTWNNVLPVPLQGVPLNTLTLADVLTANPSLTVFTGRTTPPAMTLSDLDVHDSPLTSVPLTSVALGGLLLSNIPINAPSGSADTGLAAWCDWMNGVDGFHCTAATLQGQSVMSAALAGAPLTSVPLTSVPLTSVDLSSTPLTSVPLTSVSLQGSPLTSVPLTSVDMSVSPLTSVPLTSVSLIVDCTKVDCATATLGQAAAAGAIRPDATLGDIARFLPPTVTLGNIGRGLPATPVVTLQDILDLLMGSTAALNWEDGLPLQGLQDYASDGGAVTETATFTLHGTGAATNADVSFTLPVGFRYVAGSAALGGGPGAVSLPDASGQTLTFHLTGLAFETSYGLSVKVTAGLDLGTGVVSASLTPVGVPTQTAPLPASMQVVDSFTGAHSQSTATAIVPSTLYLSHLASRSEVNWYKLALPDAGTRIRIHLSHLGADADLAVLGPPQQALRTAPLTSVPLTSVQMGDTASGLSPAGDSLTAGQLDDNAAQLVASGQLAVYGTSDNRGTSDEEVDFTSAGQGGYVYVLVSKYDNVPMPDPYMLRVEELPPPPLPACTARTFNFAGQGTSGTVPTIASTTQTLVLVNEKRLGNTYGAAAEASVVSALQSFVARSDVKGQILDVGANGATAPAYASWDANPCSPQLANGVVRAIGSLLDTAQLQDPGLKYLVIGGGDDEIPSARLIDSTLQANEATFWSSFPFTMNNEYIGAVARGYLLSDDPYGDPDPQQFLGGQLYVPKLAMGRLVETPADIVNQLTAYAAANGALNPQGELTTGYDFLLDGATSVEQGLLAAVPSGTGSDLLSNTWSHTDLVGKLWPSSGTPTIDSINAHYDQYRSLPALGNATHNQSDLFQSAEIATHGGASAARGRLVFTMGCHSGFTLFDQLFAGAPVASGFALDWPQAWTEGGAAGFMGNLGFGLGDDAAIAYSERLNVDFAQRLNGTMTVGQALEYAKQQYVGDLGVVSLYDAKASNEATYYGLPMYRVGTGTPPAPPPSPPTFTDGATGLTSALFSTSPTLTPVSTSLGNYYTIGGQAQVTNRRPIEPLTTIDMTEPGAALHGALITGLTSTDTPGFHSAFSRVVSDQAANEPELTGDVDFPAKPQSVGTLTTPNGDRQRIVLIAGQFRSGPGGADVGTQQLYTHIAGRAFYSSSPDFVAPTLTGMEVLQAGSQVAFSVSVHDFTETGADGTIKQAIVLYRDGSGVWQRIDLACSAGRCSGAGPLTGTQVDYLAEAVDAAGNVGATSGKAAASGVTLPAATGPSHITITPSTQPQASGFYPGAVHLTAANDTSGVTLSVSVDGGAFTPYTGGIDVSGDGVHTIEARGSDGADALSAVAIDANPPTVTLTTPQNGTVYQLGDSRVVDFTCADAGSGVASCTGTQPVGAQLDTSAGTHTFTVTAADRMGHTTSVTVTYQVVDLVLKVSIVPSTATRGTLVTASASLTNTAPVARSVTLTATFMFGTSSSFTTPPITVPIAAGRTYAVSIPFRIPGSLPRGTYSVRLRASDAAGAVTATATLTVT